MNGPEPGGPDPSGFERAELRLLLCRLSTAAEVQASVTHRALLWAARRVPGVHAELAFRPAGDPRTKDDRPGVAVHPLSAVMADERRVVEGFARDDARGVRGGRSGRRGGGMQFPAWRAARRSPPGERIRPGWTGSASGEPARRFEVLGLTLSVAQEALNLPRLLHASGVPLGAAARAADPSCPLVVLGGHSAPVASFLHGRVDDGGDEGLVDAVVVGDGLTALPALLSIVAECRRRGASRAETLGELAREVAGVYVPSEFEHVYEAGRLTRIRGRADDPPTPVRRSNDPPEAWRGYDGAYLPWTGEAGEETLPVAFGCPHRCRFCRDGWAMGPHRQLDPDLVVEIAARMKAALAATDLNLLSPDLGCQHGLFELLARLLRIYPRLSAKSLAGISFVRSPALAPLLPRLGKREVTVGVEGVSARLRAWLGKRFDAEVLPELLGPMHRAGLRQAKLFFIATGRETDADFDEASRLLSGILRAAPRLRLLVSAMPLFPAPGTPLAFVALPDVREPLRRLEAASRGAGAEFRVSASPEEIRAAALLARAGRAGTPALVRASLEDRIAYDGELKRAEADRVVRRLKQDGLDVEALSAEIGEADVCPWDDLDLGVSRETLRKEYAEGREGGDFAQRTQRTAKDAKTGGDPAGTRSRKGLGTKDLQRAAMRPNSRIRTAGFSPRASVPAGPHPGPEGTRRLGRRAGRGSVLATERAVGDLPDPFAERVRAVLLFRVEAGAADAPAITLARGALREWFLGDGAAAAAFAGIASVVGVEGTSGLRVVVAEFAASFAPTRLPEPRPVPGTAIPARPLGILADAPGRPWFEATARGADAMSVLRRVVEGLRPAVRYRVDRTAGGRRLVVDKGFWNRAGLAAAHEVDGGLRLFVSAAGATIARAMAEAGSRLECEVLLDAEPAAKCPTCGHPAFRRCGSETATGGRVCPGCGIRSGRADRS